VKRPTAADVARLAGVSRTQVSYVFSHDPDSHVSPERSELILRIAREIGYEPQHSAQTLRKGISNEFGLLFPAPYSYRVNTMLGRIHEAGLAEDCLPVQLSFHHGSGLVDKHTAFQALLARKPRGLFFSLFDVTLGDIAYLRTNGIENILIYDAEPHSEFPTLVVPMEAIGYLAAQHLLQQGHRRLGIIKPPPPAPPRVYELRVAGMRHAMADFPFAELSELPWPTGSPRPDMELLDQFITGAGLEDGRVTGLYTYADEFALPLIPALLNRHVSIPGQIALIGTDDVPFASIVRPALTTIGFDQDSLGNRALEMINSLIRGCGAASESLAPLTPKLVRRQST
jgi:DNA-binding LacI/PurR family transcriptional regulator